MAITALIANNRGLILELIRFRKEYPSYKGKHRK